MAAVQQDAMALEYAPESIREAMISCVLIKRICTFKGSDEVHNKGRALALAMVGELGFSAWDLLPRGISK